MPPLAGSWASTSSGMLRGWSQTARAEECEKITGASVTRRASRMVSAETCERSTSMPRRFISRTTSSPKRVRPPATGLSVAESAHGRLSLWVSVRYRTPSRYRARRVASEELMLWPPSAPIREAIRPSARAASTSSAVSASRSRSGCRSVSVRTKSICSSVALTARSPAKSARTYTDQNCAPTPPAARRARSVCSRPLWSAARSTASRS